MIRFLSTSAVYYNRLAYTVFIRVKNRKRYYTIDYNRRCYTNGSLKKKSVFPVITRERRYPLCDWKWSIRLSKTVGNSRLSVELLWNRFCNLYKQLNPARNIKYYARVQWKFVFTTIGVGWGSVVILWILVLPTLRDFFFGNHFLFNFFTFLLRLGKLVHKSRTPSKTIDFLITITGPACVCI